MITIEERDGQFHLLGGKAPHSFDTREKAEAARKLLEYMADPAVADRLAGALTEHGSHNQKDHGNWAKGRAGALSRSEDSEIDQMVANWAGRANLEAADRIRSILSPTAVVDLAGIESEVANRIAGQLEKLREDFPEEVFRSLGGVQVRDPVNGYAFVTEVPATAYAAYGILTRPDGSHSATPGIILNRQKVGSLKSLEAALLNDQAKGWSVKAPKGQLVESLVTHEMGHFLHAVVSQTYEHHMRIRLPRGGPWAEKGRTYLYDTYEGFETGEVAQTNQWNYKTRVSDYATTNVGEAWAESYAAYKHSYAKRQRPSVRAVAGAIDALRYAYSSGGPKSADPLEFLRRLQQFNN